MMNRHKSRGGAGRILRACAFSVRGLCGAWRHEAAFRQELLLCLIALPLAWWLARSVPELLALLGVLVLVLVVELLNSALEAVADAVTLEDHPLIGRAKDMASAAVMLALVLAAIVWLAVAWQRLVN
ncbi:MAG: diacylglycerol kinase [Castellaniella sp.]